MFRGTTPTLYFKLNNVEDLTKIEDLWFTIKDKCKTKILVNRKLSKNQINIDYDNKIISVDLTQKETLTFEFPEVKAQLKILFKDGEKEKVSVSPIFTLKVDDTLNTKEMKKEIVTPPNNDEDTSDSNTDSSIESGSEGASSSTTTPEDNTDDTTSGNTEGEGDSNEESEPTE